METKNIYQRMLAIQSELANVAKNLEVSMGQNNKYKAVGEADVLKAVKPLEEKYGVYSYPASRRVIESGTLESVDYKGNAKKQLFERLEIIYRFVNVDKPDEYIEITSYGDGIDSGDKSVGKAMTYADKYALMKGYKITTGEDPDQDASDDLKTASTQKSAEAPKRWSANVRPQLSEALLEEAKELDIDIENVAKYLKKNVCDLTNDELADCIERKKRRMEK